MKFSIRDLLWLTVVVALALGWWLDRSYLDQQVRALKAQEKMVMKAHSL